MSQMNSKGPENKGSKTGRKLGKCKKTEEELEDLGEIGIGDAKRHLSGGGVGKGKRLRYNERNK